MTHIDVFFDDHHPSLPDVQTDFQADVQTDDLDKC